MAEEGRGWKAAAQPASPRPCSLGALALTSGSAELTFWGSPWPHETTVSSETQGQDQPVLGGGGARPCPCSVPLAMSLSQAECYQN